MAGRRTLTMGAAALIASLVVLDARQSPRRQWTAAAAIGVVHAYQRFGAPVISASGIRCRFVPSCSRYAADALARHGIARGGWLSLRRVARCGPWTPIGTVDHPPQ